MCASRRRTPRFIRKHASATSPRRVNGQVHGKAQSKQRLSRPPLRALLTLRLCVKVLVMNRLALCLLLWYSASRVSARRTHRRTKQPKKKRRKKVTIVLATGNTLLVDEVSESSDGYWYKRGNITTFLDRERVTRIEHPKPEGAAATAEAKPGKWSLAEAARVEHFSSRSLRRRYRLTALDNRIYTRAGDWTTAMVWTLACIPTALKVAP